MADIKAHPLAFMHKLSESVFFYRSTSPALPDAVVPEPKLIALFGWAAARDEHLAKYVIRYRELYPSSSILLVKTRIPDMLSSAVAHSDIKPATLPLRDVLGTSHTAGGKLSPAKPELLIHIFSNGGSRMLNAMYDVYAATAASKDKEQRALPLHATIIDSAPALRFEFDKIVWSIAQGIPPGVMRTILKPAIQLICLLETIRIKILGIPDGMVTWAANHNNKNVVQETRRVYLYSDVDPVISQQDVEEHAAEADANGFSARLEFFPGSPHVAHMRTDPERYWTIVHETWAGSSSL